MDDLQKMERLRKMVREEKAENLMPGWWYLSFAGGDTGWCGGVIVLGHGFASAVLEAHLLKLSPGGQVTGHPVPKDLVPAPKFRNRLLTKAELEECWGPLVKWRVGEHGEMIVAKEE
jgi:hypothetical protein